MISTATHCPRIDLFNRDQFFVDVIGPLEASIRAATRSRTNEDVRGPLTDLANDDLGRRLLLDDGLEIDLAHEITLESGNMNWDSSA
jgi:hypothetical protein